MAKKEVANVEENLPMSMEDMQADAGAGMENMGAADIAMPFLAILQKSSAVVGELEGASPGNFFNTVDQSISDADPGVEIIPCAYERKWVKWRDIDAGGGYLGDYPAEYDWKNEFTANDKGRLISNEDPDVMLIETAYQYVMYRTAGTDDPFQAIVFPLKSSALTPNRKFNKQISETKIPGTDTTAPRWLHSYTVTTERKEDGSRVWWVPVFRRSAEYVTSAQYEQAKQLYELFKANVLIVNPEQEISAGVSDGPKTSTEDDDEVPF